MNDVMHVDLKYRKGKWIFFCTNNLIALLPIYFLQINSMIHTQNLNVPMYVDV